MKTMSAAVQTLLAGGQYVKWDLYKFTLAAGTVVQYYHDADYTITTGGQTYLGGLIFKRGALKQTNDLSVQTVSLDVSPQYDYPGGPPTVNGFQFLAAVKQGLMDGGFVAWSKLFLPIPSPSNNLSWPDLVTYTPVPWFTGIITDVKCGRQTASFTVSSIHELMNIQMPRNLVMPGCTHIVYDAGCTLAKATFRISGTVTAALTPGVLTFSTGLTQVDNYFNLGVITFTSGVNNGVTRTVRSSLNANGQVTVFMPFNTAPANGDTFTILPGCDKQQATCANNNSAVGAPFNNLAHFRGLPYVPEPETIYDGMSTTTSTDPGRLTPGGGGSGPGANRSTIYKP